VNAEIVNKFIGAVGSVLSEYFNITVKPGGGPSVAGNGMPMDEVMVILSIIGDLEGQFMFGYSDETALNVARSMMGNPDYEAFDDLCRSALSELSNIVGGMSTTQLAAMGFVCDLAPPSVITGSNMRVQMSATPMLVVPVDTSAGVIRLFIAVRKADK
jgi:chemotaxis protein CheX